MSRYLTPLIRISLALVCLTLNLIIAGDLLTDLMTDPREDLHQTRKTLLENLAVQYSVLAEKGQTRALQEALQALAKRNPEQILSAALRLKDGTLLAEAGEHRRYWMKPPGDQSTFAHRQVPIFNGNARWGTLEVSFAEETASGIAAYLAHPAVQFFGFVASAGFFVYLLFMRKTLELLDPSGIVPDRVRAAFDALSEGILLMDARERVVLANNVFMAKTGHDQQSMRMVKPSSLPWRLREGEADYPWVTTLRLGKPRSQILMELPEPGGEDLRFMVNTTPITNGKGKVRGVLASFDDVTPLHEVNAHLRTLVQELEASRQEIARKNDELLRLATRDPLTGCFNRRAFFEAMEAMFLDARKSGQELCCIMTDVDHFKSFNDRYGHAVGDQVIQVVARSLAAGLRNNDLLCRYGGEEFCIILPDVDITQAQAIAERIRAEIETTSGTAIRTTQDIRVTSSFGVSSLAFGATEPTELIEQADAALYASKQAGRNRVSRYDRPDDSAETANAPRFATTH